MSKRTSTIIHWGTVAQPMSGWAFASLRGQIK